MEETFDYIAFISMGNQSFEKKPCLLEFIMFAGEKGKNLEQCAIHDSR